MPSLLKILAHVLPVLFAFLLTPFPTRWGLYQWASESYDHPAYVGLLPCTIASKKGWGFTFEEFYEGVAGVDYDDENAADGEAAETESAKNYRNRLWGQTALVTGANSGMGYEISLALARLGVSVTMACRNPARCKAAAETIRQDELVLKRGEKDRGLVDPSSSVLTMTVDTSSLKSVRQFCNDFKARTDDGDGVPMPLDMLFLNAGIGMASPADDEEGSLMLSEDGIETMFATNVVGHHLMYKLLEPAIRRSDSLRKVPPRIVLTSSALSFLTKHPYKVPTDLKTLNSVTALDQSLYPQSKLAQILWAKELTAKLDAENDSSSSSSKDNNTDPNSIVYVNAAHPGLVATNIFDNVEYEKLPYVYKIMQFATKSIKSFMWTSEEGALTLIYLGTASKQLQKDNIRGQYFHPQSKLVKNHRFALDNDEETKVLQEKLWKFLDELVADFV